MYQLYDRYVRSDTLKKRPYFIIRVSHSLDYIRRLSFGKLTTSFIIMNEILYYSQASLASKDVRAIEKACSKHIGYL